LGETPYEKNPKIKNLEPFLKSTYKSENQVNHKVITGGITFHLGKVFGTFVFSMRKGKNPPRPWTSNIFPLFTGNSLIKTK